MAVSVCILRRRWTGKLASRYASRLAASLHNDEGGIIDRERIDRQRRIERARGRRNDDERYGKIRAYFPEGKGSAFDYSRAEIVQKVKDAQSGTALRKWMRFLEPFATEEENVAIIQSLSRLGFYEEAIATMNKNLSEEQTKASPKLLAAAIEACGRGSMSEKAFELMNQLRDCRDKAIVLKSYASSLRACAAESNYEKALILLNRMHRRGLHPREQTYLSAIIACDRASQPHRAARIVIESMQKKYPTCTNAAMSSCIRHNNPLLALKLYDAQYWKESTLSSRPGQPQTPEKKEHADFGTLSLAVAAARKAEQWHRIPVIMSELRSCALLPSGPMYCAAIIAMNKLERYAEALDFWDEMKARNFTMHDIEIHAAMEAALHCSDSVRALAIVLAAQKIGLKDMKQLIATALSICVHTNNTDAALTLVSIDGRTLHTSSEPQQISSTASSFVIEQSVNITSTASFNQILDLCYHGGRWSHVLELYHSDLNEQYHDKKSRALAISAAELGGQWQQALDILRNARLLGENPKCATSGLLTCPWTGALLPYVNKDANAQDEVMTAVPPSAQDDHNNHQEHLSPRIESRLHPQDAAASYRGNHSR